MSHTKIYGALPLLRKTEARAIAQTYYNEVDQGTVETYDDFLREAQLLPQALGSLVFHFGIPGSSRAERVIQTRHRDWKFAASALRTSRVTSVQLRRYRRYAHIGPREQASLSFVADDPASGSAVQTAVHHPRSTSQPNKFWQDYQGVFAPEQLPGLLAIGQVLVQDLLDITAQKP